jgi:hypothetical protein
VVLEVLYVEAISDELDAIGVQLQAKNRDFWDTYDRKTAEGEFRIGISLPIAVIIFLMAHQSGNQWWWVLLVAPVFLLFGGVRYHTMATEVLVQAVVLKMVEPPVLERLREVVAKKQQGKEQAQPESANGKKDSDVAPMAP